VKKFCLLLLLLWLATVAVVPTTYAARAGDHLYNGSFEKIVKLSPTDKRIVAYEKRGWKFPRPIIFPKKWGVNPGAAGKGSTLEVVTDGAHMGHRFIRIGGGGHVVASYGKVEKGKPYIVTLWARGKGKVWAGVYRYAGPPAKFLRTKSILSVNIDTNEWVQYRALFRNKDPNVYAANLALSAIGPKPVDIDDVDFFPATPGEAMVVEELSKLYGTGALIENMNVVQADEAFAQKQAEYKSALKKFRDKSASLDKELVESLEKEIKELDPYVLTRGLSAVQSSYYNEMIAMTRVLRRLAGEKVEAAVPVKAKAVEIKKKSAAYHKPGFRPARPGTVTITEIKPDRILYKENDEASLKATIVNKSDKVQKGTLIALMHLDLDTVRELKREPVTIVPGGKKTWRFSYNVGPETYGRGIEVRFVGEYGKIIDSWQEFYQVAAEWMRVLMPTGSDRYQNYRHYHSSEPTDFGVHVPDAEQYIAGQTGYHINQAGRRRQIEYYKKKGIKQAFYQNRAFSGIMGYEEVRKHPEYVLYDENGQFAVDPVYGGYPNPMELASPIEVGPKRKPKKSYLNRRYTPWQHVDANFASEEVVEYEANCIKKYAKAQGFDGVFFDGVPGAIKGYDYDGKLDVPVDDERKIARLNARILNTYQGILKEDNPDFGTWFNFSYPYVERFRRLGRTQLIGFGVGKDVSDEAIRALTGWKNVACLMEWQGTLRGGRGFDTYPAKTLVALMQNRDYLVQKYGASVVVGWIGIPIDRKNPGPSRWGWPTINYFMGQIIATQHHIVTWSMPSLDPSFQFQTRYSRLLWARDIKIVPTEEVDKIIQLKTPEKIWWKRLVYRRKRDDGYDLIIHLVRIPPTEKWDINWIDEPAPLEGVKISADIGSARLQTVQALRPYYYEEEQQPVQKVLKASADTGKVAVEVPPFRYYTMLVFRVRTR